MRKNEKLGTPKGRQGGQAPPPLPLTDEGPTYEGLTPQQARAIGLLMTERTLTDAARAAGITRRTLTEWVRLPKFAAALEAAEAEVIGITLRRLTNATGEAVTTLVGLMTAADAPAAVRLRAADSIIGRVVALRELWQLEQRIATLEQVSAARDKT